MIHSTVPSCPLVVPAIPQVAQLAGYVSEHSAYHHGEASLQSTIIGLAQDFVGSNNLNLLYPSGQFGTRLQGGKDAASARQGGKSGGETIEIKLCFGALGRSTVYVGVTDMLGGSVRRCTSRGWRAPLACSVALTAQFAH